jgi:rhamnosyltransferase
LADEVLALMVLYKPHKIQLMSNIEAAVNQIDMLLLLDNSPQGDDYNNLVTEIEPILSKYKDKVEYKHNDSNLGLPPCYNYAIDLAKTKKMKFLLLLDQDSNLSENVVSKLLSAYYFLSKTLKVGAVCSLNKEKIDYSSDTYLWDFYERKGLYKKGGIREVELAINSGFMAPISVYEEVGNYDENYFLDCVDQEMCLRIRNRGYKIFLVEGAIVNHSEAELIIGNLIFLKFYVKRNDPIRYYYISRGTLQLLNKYIFSFPSISLFLVLSLVGRNLRIILFPSKKLRSWFYSLLGIIHFFKGKIGIIPQS